MAEHTDKRPRRTLRIGKYEVINHIASGGMGAVYRATDTELNQVVALKVLDPALAAKPSMVERFKREAKSASQLRHENIVAIHEFGEANGTFFLALEFVEGVDLHDYITRRGRLSADEARQITVQAARALEHAHKHGIVHRDVKPSNFLIAKQGQEGRLLVKLTDMGLAKQIREDEGRVTKVGTTVGTVDYMAPEQARNSAAADIRSDIYALGCTLYHMLAGCAPFPEGSMAERIFKHEQDEPPDVRTLNPDVPADLVAVMHQMLQKKPADRYQTPSELLADLENPHGVKVYQSQSDGLSRLADLAEEESSRPAEPRTRVRSEPVTDLAADVAADVVDDLAEVPEEEVLIPAGKRTKRFRDQDAPPRAGAAGDADGARGAGKPGLKPIWWIIPSVSVLALIVIIIVIVSQSGGDAGTPRTNEPFVLVNKPPPAPPAPPQNADNVPDKEAEREKEREKAPEKQKESSLPIEVKKSPEPPPKKPPLPPANVAYGPPAPEYPPLFTPIVPLNRAMVRQEFMGDFVDSPEPPAEAMVLRVGRGLLPGASSFATLAEALAHTTAEQPAVIEVHDNGPLFTAPLEKLSLRRLWIRAAPGYRPLVAWEHPTRPAPRKDDEDSGTCLLALSRTTLVLHDLDFVTKWPEATSPAPAAFFILRNTELHARGCTFSLAGKPADGVAVVHVAPGLQSASLSKARLSRCYARGAALMAARADGCAAEVLLDRCLFAGGEQPLFVARTRGDDAVTVRVLRSTLVANNTVLDAHPGGFVGSVTCLCCDTLLARSDPRAGGEMVRLARDVNVDRLTCRALNCIFAGWNTLFTSSNRTITGQQLSDWKAQWSRQDGIQTQADAWPRAASLEPENVPASAYATQDGPVHYAAVSGPGALGCEPGILPAAPADWQRRTFDRYLVPAPVLAENVAPPISPSNDGAYHGERVDLAQRDLGELLQERLQTLRPAPRVVMHLAGQGDRPIGPVSVRGIKHLVLYAESSDKGSPLTLIPDARAAGDRAALFDVQGGILEIIGARILFKNDKFAPMPRYMFNIKNGDVRLARCYLQGPLTRGPDYFQGLFRCEDASAGEPCGVSIHESIVLGAPTVLRAGAGVVRLRVKQSVVVAPGDFVRLELGPRSPERIPFYALLENNTIALRRTLLHMTDAAADGSARAPVLVQATGNAFLAPFTDEAGRACLLRCDADTLARGEVFWQGAGNGFDERRLSTLLRIGDGDAGGLGRWRTLWGAAGERKPLAIDWPASDKFTFAADAPRFERLALPPQLRPTLGERLPGADLPRLGIQKKKN